MADWVIVLGFGVIVVVGAFVALLVLENWRDGERDQAARRMGNRDYEKEIHVARERLRGRKERV